MTTHVTLWTCFACLLWLPSWILAQHRFSAPYRASYHRPPIPLYIPYPFQNGPSNSEIALNSADQQDDQTTTDQYDQEEDYTDRTPKSENDFQDKTLEDQFLIIKPADAAAIALLNIVGIIMMALGSTVKIVGRRSIREEDTGRKNVILEGLRLGSNGSNQMCVQRAACQAPKKAEVMASAANFLVEVVNFGFKWIPVSPIQLSNMAAALHKGSTSGSAGFRCDHLYPCPALTAVT